MHSFPVASITKFHACGGSFHLPKSLQGVETPLLNPHPASISSSYPRASRTARQPPAVHMRAGPTTSVSFWPSLRSGTARAPPMGSRPPWPRPGLRSRAWTPSLPSPAGAASCHLCSWGRGVARVGPAALPLQQDGRLCASPRRGHPLGLILGRGLASQEHALGSRAADLHCSRGLRYQQRQEKDAYLLRNRQCSGLTKPNWNPPGKVMKADTCCTRAFKNARRL